MSSLKITLGVLALASFSAWSKEDFIVEKKAVMFVLDISGSMQGQNLSRVQGTLAQVVKSMPGNTTYGLVSFAGCSANDVKLEVPLTPGNGGDLIARANSLRPYGSTDIYGGLAMANQEIKRLGSDWCVKVMLLSDGADTCSKGDVKGITKQIVGDSAGCNSISTITISVPSWESQVFEDIAKDGNGVHTPVENPDEIEEKIDQELEDFLRRKEGTKPPGWTGDYDPSKPKPNDPAKPEDKPKDPDAPAGQPDPNEARNRNKKKQNGGN